MSDNYFDNVISLNTLEHIYNAKEVITEITRVLKKGGVFFSVVPFLFPIHGHPDDYFRPTSSWWVEVLKENGFQEVEIFPLSWGPFSTGASCSGLPGPFKKIRLISCMILDLIHFNLSKQDTSYYRNSPLSIAVIAKL